MLPGGTPMSVFETVVGVEDDPVRGAAEEERRRARLDDRAEPLLGLLRQRLVVPFELLDAAAEAFSRVGRHDVHRDEGVREW